MQHLSDRIDNLAMAPSFASDIEFLGSRLSRIEKNLWPVKGSEGLPLNEGQKRFVGLGKGPAATLDTRSVAEKYQPTDPYKKREGIMLGRKDDDGKERWDLLPMRLLRGAVRVLGFGAKKYGANQWMTVEIPRARYYAALQRHLSAYQAGKQKDVESGESHLDHAMCCLLFLKHFEEIE